MNFSLSPVVRVLLIINFAVFGLQLVTYEAAPMVYLYISNYFSLNYVESKYFYPFQFITYMFLHGDLMHIISNMFGLFMFGPLLEGILGSRKFFLLYMIAGMGAGLLNMGILFLENRQLEADCNQYLKDPNPIGYVHFLSEHYPKWNYDNGVAKSVDYFDAHPNQPEESIAFIKEIYDYKTSGRTVGASGAVFALLVAFAMIFPNLELFLLFFPFPIKAKYFVTIYVLYEIYAGLGYAGNSNIAHFAHVSGALVGFLMIRYWKIPRRY